MRLTLALALAALSAAPALVSADVVLQGGGEVALDGTDIEPIEAFGSWLSLLAVGQMSDDFRGRVGLTLRSMPRGKVLCIVPGALEADRPATERGCGDSRRVSFCGLTAGVIASEKERQSGPFGDVEVGLGALGSAGSSGEIYVSVGGGYEWRVSEDIALSVLAFARQHSADEQLEAGLAMGLGWTLDRGAPAPN